MSRPLHTACFFAAWKRVEANPVPSSRSGHRALLAAGRYADSSLFAVSVKQISTVLHALHNRGAFGGRSLRRFFRFAVSVKQISPALHAMHNRGAFGGRVLRSFFPFAVSVKQISTALHALHNRGVFGGRSLRRFFPFCRFC